MWNESNLSYHESLQRIVKGDVDAVIWNVVAENELTMLGLEATPLTDDAVFTGHRSRGPDASK